MLKMTRLFYSSTEDNVFHDQILPTAYQQETLEHAKVLIREHLRIGIKEATTSTFGMNKAIEPRFRTQGSWKYKTCVQPASLPPQEMDWDYGVYLPVTLWEDNGPPHEMARLYFDLVENLLSSLCKKEGWELVPGKNTCIRIQISSWAHIDLPLYAAPEKEFKLIMEKAFKEARSSTNDGSISLDAQEELTEQAWDDLDQIVMATRSGEWKASDPEAVSKWFLDRISEHTDQLRRVCRYFKAWRDYHWGIGGPTSVSIMIAVGQSFVAWRGRDDVALEDAARRLSLSLNGDIRESGIDGEKEDFNRLSPDERVLASSKVSNLATILHQARMLNVGRESTAIAMITAEFGQRIPDKWNLVEPNGSSDGVRSIPARTVTMPVVAATKAGKAG
jgi:hypothetical protein